MFTQELLLLNPKADCRLLYPIFFLPMEILRTSKSGCFTLTSNAWGQYLSPTNDPLADTIISKEQMEGFEINPDVPKIPYLLWSRWVSLCYEMTRLDSRNLEVSCRILRNEADPSLYRIAVPEQTVTTASVRVDSFDKAIDIATGEVIHQWPPEGWRPCGSSHSHNTMDAFFSGTDDHYELGDPGLHIVVGNIDPVLKEHTLVASITANKRRFLIEPSAVLDPVDATSGTYHSSVLDIIKLPKASALPLYPQVSYTSWSYRTPATASQFSEPRRVDLKNLAKEILTFNEQVDVLTDVGRQRGYDELEVLKQLRDEIEDRIDDQYYFAPSDPFYYQPY